MRNSIKAAFPCQKVVHMSHVPTVPFQLLLVEDAPDQAVLFGRWLTRYAPIEVTLATSGFEAISLLSHKDFDLMLTDIELPGMNGIEVARQASRLRPFMAIALMTAHCTVEYATRAVRTQVAELILKPLTRESLVAKVIEISAESRKARANNQRTVLAVGAHPDDVEIGCGGILLRHREAGDRVVILTLTGGAQGGTASLRRNEAQQSARILQADLHVAELQDTCVTADDETIAPISKLIRELAPSVVYTHSIHDTHQDHRNAHRATLVAARTVPHVYCYQSPSATTEYCPLAFIDIGRFLKTKIELIAAFQSQTEKCAYLDADLIRATARYWGRFAGNARVEPLEVIRALDSMRCAI